MKFKRNKKMEASIDTAFQNQLAANAAEPYVHAEYARCERITKAWITIYTKGDERFSFALYWAFMDSMESMDYYLSRWSKEELIEMFWGVVTQTSYDEGE